MILSGPRFSTQYAISGTTTFRLSSRMITTRITRPPRDGKVGGNAQNWNKEPRRLIISDGWTKDDIPKLMDYLVRRDLSIFTDEERARIRILVQVDQSGAEALIVAYLSQHGNFRNLFLNNIKPHCYVGLQVFADVWKKELPDIRHEIDSICNCAIENITSNPFWNQIDAVIKSSDDWPSNKRYYYIAKQICHSSNYGAAPPMFQMNTLEKSGGKIAISKHEAERFLSMYHSLFPEIHEWHRDVNRQLVLTKTLYNLFGYPREFIFNRRDPDDATLREAYAFPAQSTVGTITNMAFTKHQEYIEDNKLHRDQLQNGHDSYVTQCPIGEEKDCGRVMQEFINADLIAPSDGTKFKMKSEAQCGFNWAPYKKDKNLLGLVKL